MELYLPAIFVEWAHCDVVDRDRERALFFRPMKKWLKGYDGNWLQSADTDQAVTNTLDY